MNVHKRAGRLLLAFPVLAVFVALAASGKSISAQEAPRPTVIASGSVEIEDSSRQYDLVQMLVEFGPGASNVSHRVAGLGIFTVLSGEITRIEDGGPTTVFQAGDTFREVPDDRFDVEVNNGSEPAQLLATFLLTPGGDPLIIHPNAMAPAIGPKALAVARTTLGTIPGAFTLSHGMIETPAGGVAKPHVHDGWQMVTILEGEPNVILGGEVHSGATFIDRPGVVHEGNNPGPGAVKIMFASVRPTGSPPARPLASQASIVPPSTGDGGLLTGR